MIMASIVGRLRVPARPVVGGMNSGWVLRRFLGKDLLWTKNSDGADVNK